MTALRRAALCALTVASLLLPLAPAHAASGSDVVDVPIEFQVVNRNRTTIRCSPGPDGATYPVRGTLVAPRSVLAADKPAVTLYLHGLGYGGWFFRYDETPGYDYARNQAQAGHASVVVDRLGNPNSDALPDGANTCFPSQADTVDQMIQTLRTGAYKAKIADVAFSRVVLAGHSAGGLITELTQAAFGSADAVAIVGYTDYPSPLAFATFFTAGQDCLTAPRKAHGSAGAPNYAAFGRSNAEFAAGHFYDVDDSVAARVLYRRNVDPCGDLLNALQSLLYNRVGTTTIGVPVLLISGTNDALFAPPTNRLQAAAFPAVPKVEVVELPETGHAVTLGRSHEAFRKAMETWLRSQGA